MVSVFLSHSAIDKRFVRAIAKTLRDAGVNVWFDEAELQIGDSLIEKISAAIEKTDFVLAVLSKHSVRSRWVQQELRLAMTKEINGKRAVVLPLRIDRCELPSFLGDKIYADFTSRSKYDSEIQRLLRAIGAKTMPSAGSHGTLSGGSGILRRKSFWFATGAATLVLGALVCSVYFYGWPIPWQTIKGERVVRHIDPKPEPSPPPRPDRLAPGTQFGEIRGRAAWFGGPNDPDVRSLDTLAFYTAAEADAHPELFSPQNSSKTLIIGQRLKPEVFYISAPWNFDTHPRAFLKQQKVRVINPKTGLSAQATVVDFDPSKRFGRICNLSPGLMKHLNLEINDEVIVQIPNPPPK